MKTDGFIQKGRQWMAQENNAAMTIFLLFFLVTFAKTLLFNHFAFHNDLALTFKESPEKFFGSLLCKLSVSLILASFVFLLKDKRWMILVSFIIDAWCIANLIYMRNNNILLDGEAFNQAGNIHGYSSSVLIYIEWGIDLIFLLLTALWSLIFIFTSKSDRIAPLWIIVLFGGVILRLAGDGINDSLGNNLMKRDSREEVFGWSFSQAVRHTSIIESPLYVVSDYFAMKNKKMPYHPLTRQDKFHLEPLVNTNDYHANNEPLIIILVESLENWVCRPDIMPNLWRLANSEHVLYADKIHTQIVGAPSADGQMIINTGLLPINAGATCLHYPHNTYPALMKITDERSVCLLSHDTRVWNQTEMSPAFGYDTTIVWSDVDTLLFAELNRLVDSGERHIQCITQSTHAPFLNHTLSSLELPHDMPWVMSNYIGAFNALDYGLGLFIQKLENDPKLQDYTVVITGDHRILHREARQRMMRWSQRNGLDYNVGNDYLPLIVYSPRIEGNIHYTAEAYQMDIYPTVLNILGAKDYLWKGIGANLLDDEAVAHRYTSPAEAASTCDRMIRNDYFGKLKKENKN